MRNLFLIVLFAIVFNMTSCSNYDRSWEKDCRQISYYNDNHEYVNALNASQRLIDACGDFKSDRCLVFLTFYLRSGVMLLSDLDTKGDYSQLYTYATIFNDRVSRIKNQESLIWNITHSKNPALAAAFRGEQDLLNNGFTSGQRYLALYYAFMNDFPKSSKHFEALRLRSPRIVEDIKKPLQYARDLNSDDRYASLLNGLKGQMSLEALFVASHQMLSLYDLFAISNSQNVEALRQELKEKMPKVAEKSFNEGLYKDIYMGLIDGAHLSSATREKLKNIGNDIGKDNVMQLFQCSFINLIGKIINQSNGLDIKLVMTGDKMGLEKLENSQGLAQKPLHARKRPNHVLGLLKLGPDQYVFIDFLNFYAHDPFSLKETYIANGKGYYEILPSANRNDLYRHFFIVPDEKILAVTHSTLADAFTNNVSYYQAAQELSQQTLNFWPDCFSCYVGMANLLLQSKSNIDSLSIQERSQWAQSVKELIQKSLSIYPKNSDGYLLLTLLNYLQKDYQSAVLQARRAIDIDEHNLVAYNLLADSQRALGQYDDARKTYETALALDPLDPAANGGLGRTLYSMGQRESGKAYLMKAIESYRHDGNYLIAAEIDKLLSSLN